MPPVHRNGSPEAPFTPVTGMRRQGPAQDPLLPAPLPARAGSRPGHCLDPSAETPGVPPCLPAPAAGVDPAAAPGARPGAGARPRSAARPRRFHGADDDPELPDAPGADEQPGSVSADSLWAWAIPSRCPGHGGAFADGGGRGGHGVPPPLHPLPLAPSHPGVARPGTGAGAGGRAVPGLRSCGRGARGTAPPAPQRHRDRGSQHPTSIGVLRRG